MTTLHGCVQHGFMANLRYEWICEVSSSSLKMTMHPLTHQKKNIWILRKPPSKKNGGFHFLCHNECDGGVGFYWQICKFSGTPPPNRPSCRLCASEGKHLPKKVVSKWFRITSGKWLLPFSMDLFKGKFTGKKSCTINYKKCRGFL